VIFAEGEVYAASDLSLTDDAPTPPGRSEVTLTQSERSLIARALKRNSFNISHAAKELGLTRAALYRRMAKHGL
jgi:two-component system response regulator RegA